MDHWEFVLFIKLFIVTKMEISKNTLLRGIESDVACAKLLEVVSYYILRSGSLWRPLNSRIPKNKWNVSLVIPKLVSVFSLWLYNLVYPKIILIKVPSKNKRSPYVTPLRRIRMLFSLLNFGMFPCSTTLISRFSYFISKTGGFG